MDCVFFYLFASLTFLIGGGLWLFNRRITWIEWLGGTAVGFALAGLFHLLAVSGATRDVETWSGQLVQGRHYAAWQEYYEYAVYRTEWYTDTETYTDSDGHTQTRTVMRSRQVFDHWEPTSRWHSDSFGVSSNIDTSYSIDRTFWYGLAERFGGYQSTPGHRSTWEHNSRMIGGDPNDYVTSNRTGYVQPVTKLVRFENKVRATPTTFSYPPVPANIKVFPYPANDNPFASDRLIGTATLVDLLAFDQMNARLGPKKRVNVVMVGLGNRDSMAAQWQEAAWIGGKKNDVVITWGGLNDRPTWVRAFGWTDSKTCLRQLESIVLENGAKTSTLPLIEAEIVRDYRLKDWDKAFAHIRVPAPMWAAYWYFGVAIVAQVGFWWWANLNGMDKK